MKIVRQDRIALDYKFFEVTKKLAIWKPEVDSYLFLANWR